MHLKVLLKVRHSRTHPPFYCILLLSLKIKSNQDKAILQKRFNLKNRIQNIHLIAIRIII